MKIWWQSSTPIHRLHDYRNALVAHLDSVKRADTQIRVSGVDEGSMDLHYNAVVAMNSFAPGGVLNKIIQAAQEGYNAVAIGCFLDPAMQEAREVVAIPVFGLGETSMLAACMYGHKFSGVAFHAKQAQYYDRKAFEYGLSARHVPFGSLGIDFREVQNAFANPSQMTETFVREARRLAAEGAEVILAACATVNAIIRREKIQNVDGALVLDCNAVLLKVTEGMADLSETVGLKHSQRLLYQRPQRESLQDWMRIYNFRAAAKKEPVL
jgi:Asp/Glu/hydantoin racemase